jgi:hypothetical protein
MVGKIATGEIEDRQNEAGSSQTQEKRADLRALSNFQRAEIAEVTAAKWNKST